MPKESNFTIRLSKAMREFNVGKDTIVEFLAKKGFQIDSLPNTKLTTDMYALLVKEFQSEKMVMNMAKRLGNLSYKGGSISVESDSYTSAVAKPIKENVQKIGKHRKQKEKDHKLKEQEEPVKMQDKSKENNKQTKVKYDAAFSELKFEQGYVSLIYNKKYCIYRNYRIRDCNKTLEQIYAKLSKEGMDALKASIVRVIIDIETETFDFMDIDILGYVNRLKEIYLLKNNPTDTFNENVERKYEPQEKGNEKEEKTNKLFKTKVERKVPFNTIRFGHGFASITYKRKRYYYKDAKIRNYDKTIKQIFSRISKVRRHSLNAFFIEVIIDIPAGTFTFKNIDICDYVNELKESSLPENYKTENRTKIRLSKAARMFNVSKNTILEFLDKNGFKINNPMPSTKLTTEMYELLVKKYQTEKELPQKPSTTNKKMTLGAGNICFYNGYYMIFQTANGEIDNSVAPCRVDDPNSQEILNLIHKYFEKVLEQKHIIIQVDDTRIIEPSKLDLFQLKNYVRYLKQSLDEKGGWWEEVQNYRKPSLKKCRSVSAEETKKKVSLKNGYLDSLVSMQSEIKLIPVYEINHGKEEDAFIFSINMPDNRCAVVFENASNDASTTTWVFVTKIENYEDCVNLVFDYFTDYTVITKRSTLRVKTVNPPKKFKAEDYTFIDHDDLGQWLKKLNRVLENKIKPSDISFEPGLHIPDSSDTRIGNGKTVNTRHLHNQLMRKLYDRLCVENGKDTVGTEIQVGKKRIDAVVKGDGCYDIYEIKTVENPFECVTEALGQLCQYTYLFCRDKIGKMVIVGPTEETKEVKDYLSWFRKNYSLQLCYLKI